MSRRPDGKCENAVIEYGDAVNPHFPDRRSVKTLVWCENPAEYKVTGRNIARSSYYCGGCVASLDPSAVTVEKVERGDHAEPEAI